MKRILLTASLIFSLHFSNAADIFTPQAKPKPADWDKYSTSAAFLSATKSGEIPKLALKRSDVPMGHWVNEIIKNEYKVAIPDKPGFIGIMIELITKYELEQDKNGRHARHYQDEFRRQRAYVLKRSNNPKYVDALDSFLKLYVNAVRESVAIMAANRAEDEIKASATKQAVEEQMQIRKQKLQEIQDSPNYKIWLAALQVEQGFKLIAEGQKALEHQDAVETESGVVNLTSRRAAGDRVVAGKSLVKQAFETYKKRGGTVQTPEEVHAGPDPAKEYR